MPTDRERERAFRRARNVQSRRLTRIQRDTHGEVLRLLKEAQKKITAELASTPSEFQAWRLPILQRSIRRAMAELDKSASARLSTAAGQSWQAGIDLVDEPLAAGGIRVGAFLPELDTGQLLAMRSFMTDRMQDVSVTLANRINSELGLAAIGASSTSQAIDRIAELLDSGGRARATTIVRTELGRAFSVAHQARQEQATERLPGLKKQWRRSGKLHSRPAHDAADGQIREVDEPFLVNGIEIMFPRDPAAPIGETINCGCQSLPYMDSWTMSQPGRSQFSEREIAASPTKRILAEITTGRRRFASIETIDRMAAGPARAEVRDILRDPAFAEFLRGRGEKARRPAAVLDVDLARALGSASRTISLSDHDARKQRTKHADLAPDDYLRVQRMIDDAEVRREGDRRLIFLLEDRGRWYRAVVKTNAGRDELYLQNYHRIVPRNVESTRRKFELLRK